MTRLLYLTHDETSLDNVTVLDCFAYEAGYAIELDRSLFHPQGGGQKSDTGHIGDLPIVKVVLDQGRLLHLSQHPIDKGQYSITVDQDVRQLNTRLHSAGHLIAHFICQSGLTPVKAHHWPGESFVSFESPHDDILFPDYTPEQLTVDINQIVASALPRGETCTDDGRRNIAFGDYEPFLCGGTHVSDLSGIGSVEITSVRLKRGKLKVSYTVS